LGFNFCDIKLWLSFQKKRKISQFTIGEKVAKKIWEFFFLKIEKKNQQKKRKHWCGPLLQKNSGNKAKHGKENSQ